MPSEADTCRTYVVPKLKFAGWAMTGQLVLTTIWIVYRQSKRAASGEELFPLKLFILDEKLKGEL
jgi:hypothetical protein